MEDIIYVYTKTDSTALLKYPKAQIEEMAYIGKNGVTTNKLEGDGCTPIGIYEIGQLFGTKPKSKIHFSSKKMEERYIQITPNMYWIDDKNSQYYNQLIDITRNKKDWKSAEKLIDFSVQYEYAIEIKVNPENIPGKGSAIFLHCSKNRPTEGCVAINSNTMKEILEYVTDKTIIKII